MAISFLPFSNFFRKDPTLLEKMPDTELEKLSRKTQRLSRAADSNAFFWMNTGVMLGTAAAVFKTAAVIGTLATPLGWVGTFAVGLVLSGAAFATGANLDISASVDNKATQRQIEKILHTRHRAKPQLPAGPESSAAASRGAERDFNGSAPRRSLAEDMPPAMPPGPLPRDFKP